MIVSRGLGKGGSGFLVGWGMGVRALAVVVARIKYVLTYIRTFPSQTFLQSIANETTVTKRGG